MQEITLVGNLGQDPETRYTKDGSMNVSFSVAVNRKRGQESVTTWFRCTAWNKQAETLDQLATNGWLHKGKQVLVRGEFAEGSYTTQNGEVRHTNEVNVGRLQLLGSKDESN